MCCPLSPFLCDDRRPLITRRHERSKEGYYFWPEALLVDQKASSLLSDLHQSEPIRKVNMSSP
jgi:hypothetical protein